MENMTEQEKFVVAAAAVFKNCLGILNQRGLKYSGTGNPFENFDRTADIAGVTTDQGILVRLGDKLGRIKNGLQDRRNAQGDLFQEWKDESLRDSLQDAINYLTILHVWLDSSEGQDLDVPVGESGLDDLVPETADDGVTEIDEDGPVGKVYTQENLPGAGWFSRFVGR